MAEMRAKSPRRVLSQRKYVELKKYVFERDQYCVFCGNPEMSTPAHIIRRSQGGHDSPKNLVRACLKCHDDFDAYKIALPEKVREMLNNEPANL